jgi:hypothetical protein
MNDTKGIKRLDLMVFSFATVVSFVFEKSHLKRLRPF